jgi:hypothetical protein
MPSRSSISAITSLAKQVAQKEITLDEREQSDEQVLDLLAQVSKLLGEKGRGNSEIQALTAQVDELIKQKRA